VPKPKQEPVQVDAARAARTRRPAPPPAGDEGPVSEARLHEAISRALLAGKLQPGTPLRERYLAEQFGVTRGTVRKVLLRLGHEGKLEMHPNRGAFVPQPSVQDMERIYGARKAVEAGVVALLASSIDDAGLKRLRAHVKQERAAARSGAREESVRLAGGFHGALVELLGNPELAAIVQKLTARTQMFVALFEPARDSGCAPDEHEAILAAFEQRDPGAAVEAMLQHLSQVEARVKSHVQPAEAAGLGDILRASLEP
jgi:DNA-binding GntR family transcriptional regulator